MLSGRPDPDSLFSPFDLTRREAVIAAVSGGSDSLAMLLLLQRWLERRASPTRLVAVTVDHRLRDSSAAEAREVHDFCAARGIPHHITTWAGEKPRSGVSEAARLARYGLLAGAAEAEGGDIVVTGHTADDQAETVAMRQARGDGRGLAGMAPATLFDGRVWIVRPLLATGRAELRRFLCAERIAWIEDPANLDRKYERPRIRAALTDAGEGDYGRDALLARAAEAGRGREHIAEAAARLVSRHAERPVRGLVRLRADFFGEAEAAAVPAFRALLAVCGGAPQFPDAGRALNLFRDMREGCVRRATLSRTVADRRRNGVFLYREKRGLPTEEPVPGTIWDGRYRIADVGDGEGSVALFPVSPPRRVPEPTVPGPQTVPAAILKAVRAAEPPEAAFDAVPVLAPWRLFLPSFDLALARAVAALAGAAEIPEPPFAGHNREEA
ncbi:MAG: tRNA lysidine(34) synthetase TilS [Rhizobiaceae bacterium]|nr:tRNA lysidine(34) synthetase TilS [Rhizobiaceae bacterium]